MILYGVSRQFFFSQCPLNLIDRVCVIFDVDQKCSLSIVTTYLKDPKHKGPFLSFSFSKSIMLDSFITIDSYNNNYSEAFIMINIYFLQSILVVMFLFHKFLEETISKFDNYTLIKSSHLGFLQCIINVSYFKEQLILRTKQKKNS